MLRSSVICWHHWFLCNKEISENPKKWWKWSILIKKIFNTFWTTWGISMNFQEKCDLWYLKVTEKQGFRLSLENPFLKKKSYPSSCTISDKPDDKFFKYCFWSQKCQTYPIFGITRTFLKKIALQIFFLSSTKTSCKKISKK